MARLKWFVNGMSLSISGCMLISGCAGHKRHYYSCSLHDAISRLFHPPVSVDIQNPCGAYGLEAIPGKMHIETYLPRLSIN
jgi:hypothetical protein